MPATKKTAGAKPAAKPAAARTSRGYVALDGLELSLDDAQKAVSELRRDLSSGERRLLKDVETAVKSARRDLARMRAAIQRDLGNLGDALTPRRADGTPASRAAKPAAKKPAAKKPAAKKPAAKKPARAS